MKRCDWSYDPKLKVLRSSFQGSSIRGPQWMLLESQGEADRVEQRKFFFFFFFRKFLKRETRLKRRARLSQVGERKEKAFQTSGKA